MRLARTFWYKPDLETRVRTDGYGGVIERAVGTWKKAEPVMDEADANLISSLLPNREHGPCLDLDYPARLIASKTEGHFHLYLERAVSWKAYKKVMKAMAQAGLIEEGYYKASKRDGMTYLRLPPKVGTRSWDAEQADKQTIHAAISRMMTALGYDLDVDDESNNAIYEKIREEISDLVNQVVELRLRGD